MTRRRRSQTPVSQAAACALMFLSTASCGDDSGDGQHYPPERCELLIEQPQEPPTTAEPLVLRALFVRDDGYVDGFETVVWNVISPDGQLLEAEEHSTQPHTVQVPTVDAPGMYRVMLTGDISGTVCAFATEWVNVRHERAQAVTYTMRAVMPGSRDTPAQERSLTVYGGAEAFVADWQLSPGSLVAGAVRTDTDQGVPAYLRFTAPQVPQVEAFADAEGAFEAPLQSTAQYEVLVVPQDPALAPQVLPPTSPGQLTNIVVSAGRAISGTVHDHLDAPLAGARVTGSIGAVPTTIAQTDQFGQFTLRADVGAPESRPLALTVVPPASSGLPIVELFAGDGLSASGPIRVKYATSLSARTIALPVYQLDGVTPAAGARVTFHARALADAATAEVEDPSGNVSASMTGAARITITAGPSGALPPTLVPEAIYDVVVEPAGDTSGQGINVTVADLRAGEPGPGSFNLAPLSRLVGQMRDSSDPGGPTLADIDVRAQPLGLLATAASAGAVDASGDGVFALSVAGNSWYQLVATSREPHFARTVATISTPTPGQELDVGALLMTPTIEISGRIIRPDTTGGAEGVHLMLMCYDCSDVDAQRPIVEAVSSSTGDYVFHVPDPGLRADGS